MLYLAYGSNLLPERLRERVSSAKLLGKAVIGDRELRFHKRSVVDGSGKCDMAKGAGEIHVAVYQIAAEQKADLDRAEGLGIGYRTESLIIPGYGDGFAYIALDTHIDESLKPYSWYKELVLAGGESLAFPRSYIDAIAAIEALQDPDSERHARNTQIVDRSRRNPGAT